MVVVVVVVIEAMMFEVDNYRGRQSNCLGKFKCAAPEVQTTRTNGAGSGLYLPNLEREDKVGNCPKFEVEDGRCRWEAATSHTVARRLRSDDGSIEVQSESRTLLLVLPILLLFWWST